MAIMFLAQWEQEPTFSSVVFHRSIKYILFVMNNLIAFNSHKALFFNIREIPQD
jgi:hypothetical protein